MYYCFLKEDMSETISNPFAIERKYAQRLGRLCIGSLSEQTIVDESNLPISIKNKKVLLRCTYDNLLGGLDLLKKYGAEVIETEEDIKKIEEWHTMGLTARNLWEIDLTDLLAAPSWVSEISQKIFLKSKQKGFSAVISTSRISSRDSAVVEFLEFESKKFGSKMILSKYFPIKSDSLGTRETRHVVWGNQVSSSSRLLHSVKHTVPRSHKIKAQTIVDKIKHSGSLPQNYILDLGEFVDSSGQVYLDIVELNPLSCSLCYVNNSVFDVAVPEILNCYHKLNLGYEYRYDAIFNPQNYMQVRVSNKNYGFVTEKRCFL